MGVGFGRDGVDVFGDEREEVGVAPLRGEDEGLDVGMNGLGENKKPEDGNKPEGGQKRESPLGAGGKVNGWIRLERGSTHWMAIQFPGPV